MKKYKNFITTGCSFTAGVITEDRYAWWKEASWMWPHHCVSDLGIEYKNFINFALPGGGNVAAIYNIIYYLQLNNIEIEDTLIGMNITGLTRQDIICHADSPDNNPWEEKEDVTQKLNIGWAIGRDKISIKNQGFDEITIHNCLAIIQGITYLESKNIDYFFMFMTKHDYILSPSWFKNFIDSRKKNWVKFGNQIGMWELVKEKNLTTDDGHPNREGQKLIASYVLDYLKNETAT